MMMASFLYMLLQFIEPTLLRYAPVILHATALSLIHSSFFAWLPPLKLYMK